MANDKNTSGRLISLDILRGLDMMFLCIVQPVVMSLAAPMGVADPTKSPFFRQFMHFRGGFTAYDIIMPLFIFMCGAAIPYALPKRLTPDGRPTAAFWKHLAWRVVMLWFLGMCCQGEILTCDPSKFAYYSNTLQAIAVGYVIAALALLVRSRAFLIALPIALTAVYGLLLHFGGDYSVSGNLAMKVDMFFVRMIQPAGHDTGSYTWYLTSLMFGAMTICGMHATQILRSGLSEWRKAGTLGILGVALVLAGLLLEKLGVPCIKQMFTVSFTVQAMGVCILLLDAFYIIADIWCFRRGWWLALLYGQGALAAYVLGDIFRTVPIEAANATIGGLAKRIGAPWGEFVFQLGVVVWLTFFLFVWSVYKQARRT